MSIRSSPRSSGGAPNKFFAPGTNLKFLTEALLPPPFLGEKDHGIQTGAAPGINCYIYTYLGCP